MHTDAGHRQRLKDRFLAEGLENFGEVHVLELLLFYAVPRKDTKPIARALLDHFGSLPLVLEATVPELMAVEGVGIGAATFLTMINQVGRYYQVRRADTPVIMNSTEDYGRYLLRQLYGRRNETVFMLCLDAKCKLLCCRKLGEGSANSANIPIRQMVEIALSVNATMVILGHNHPSGLAVPSHEDIETTQRLATALGAMDIVLVDHVVVAEDEFVSLVQSGAYNPRAFC